MPLLAGQHDAPPLPVVGIEHDAVERLPACISRRLPMLTVGRRAAFARQNRKYRCAIGSTSAGAQVSSSPSARTS